MNINSTNLIAEFCQNHLGKASILEQMVVEAKNNGASHAKIQGLYSEEITKRMEFEDTNGRIFRPYDKEVARLKSLDLSFETEKWFVEFCHKKSITPMITVFTHMGVERAKLAGFKSVKIASYDCSSIPIIKKALEFADELVISTGATYWQEIIDTVKLINSIKNNSQKIALLHARTIYPTQLTHFGILRMSALASFGFKIGLSDHTKPEETKLVASKIAILLGADYIERHFTILNKEETKDGPISITPVELKEIKDFCEKSKLEQLNDIGKEDLLSALPCASLEPTEEELINRSYYRGRVASKYNGKVFYSWEELENKI
jgi:sialic acid synthase SpsE